LCRTPITSSKTHGFIPPTFPSAHITCSCSGPTYSFVLFILLFFSQTPGPTKDPLPKPSTVDPTPTHAFPWWWWWLDDERERERERERPFWPFVLKTKVKREFTEWKKISLAQPSHVPIQAITFVKINKKKVKDNSLFNSMLMFFFLINSNFSSSLCTF
jgi:hypothetical protein